MDKPPKLREFHVSPGSREACALLEAQGFATVTLPPDRTMKGLVVFREVMQGQVDGRQVRVHGDGMYQFWVEVACALPAVMEGVLVHNGAFPERRAHTVRAMGTLEVTSDDPEAAARVSAWLPPVFADAVFNPKCPIYGLCAGNGTLRAYFLDRDSQQDLLFRMGGGLTAARELARIAALVETLPLDR